jgi:putative CRISPR-associated protein (TIGR02620 family)
MRLMIDLIVTRHPGLLEVLEEKGIATPGTPVIAHASADDLRGKHVAGVLPLALAAECASVTELALALPPEARGRELSAAEVRQYLTGIRRYRVEVLL